MSVTHRPIRTAPDVRALAYRADEVVRDAGAAPVRADPHGHQIPQRRVSPGQAGYRADDHLALPGGEGRRVPDPGPPGALAEFLLTRDGGAERVGRLRQ